MKSTSSLLLSRQTRAPGKHYKWKKQCPTSWVTVLNSCRVTVSKYYSDLFALLEHRQHHINPVFLPHLPSKMTQLSFCERYEEGVWEETLPIRFSLVTNQPLASCQDDLTFDPTVCPVLHNFPLNWSSARPCLTVNCESFHTSPCVSSSHSSVSLFLTCLSHLAVVSFLLCLCLFRYHPLSHYNPREPRGCLYSPEDVEVIQQQEKLSLSHFNQLVGRSSSRKRAIFASKLLKYLFPPAFLHVYLRRPTQHWFRDWQFET